MSTHRFLQRVMNLFMLLEDDGTQDGRLVADRVSKSDAERIVSRVTGHEKLLAALRQLRDYIDCIPESAAGGDDEALRLVRIADSAIASVEGKS